MGTAAAAALERKEILVLFSNSNVLGSQEREWNDGLLHQDEDIQGIVILAVCLWDEACNEKNRRKKKSVRSSIFFLCSGEEYRMYVP